MINFREWRKKSTTVELGDYSIRIEDIGNNKIMLYAKSKNQLIDSIKEIKKIIDLSELENPKQTGLALSAPAMEPMDNRNSYLPAN